jgi:hypothetical protein
MEGDNNVYEPFDKSIAQIKKGKIHLLFVKKLAYSSAIGYVSRLNQENFISFFFIHKVYQRVL